MRNVAKNDDGVYLNPNESGIYLNYELLTKDNIGKFLQSQKKIKLRKHEKRLVAEAKALGRPMYKIFTTFNCLIIKILVIKLLFR